MKDYVPLMETGLWVILAAAALIAFWKPVKERIKEGASVKAGPFELGGIAKRVDDVERQVNALSDTVSKLFLYTMSGPMYTNLKKLASGEFGSYEKGDALVRELYHLRDIGYIRVQSIRGLPVTGENLSDHVRVTPAGVQFVELRDSMLAGSV